jgi:hypothetical protein
VGAHAEIIVFDYERYRSEIVSALVELLRTGEGAPSLAAVFRSAGGPMGEQGYDVLWPRLAARLREKPTDLMRHCTWLGRDLRYIGESPVDRSTGKQLTCDSLTCPERVQCPFHRDNDRHGVEDLNDLFEALVALRCLGPAQFLGRSITPNFYRPALERRNVPAGDPTWGLLGALGARGAALGYGFGVTEGIHGWLTVTETSELATCLDRLDLPRYEPTFAAMATATRQANRDDVAVSTWQDLSLSFVRTVATIAADDGHGVLWGNSVFPSTWREEFGVG